MELRSWRRSLIDPQNVADKFKKYFTEIGYKLAKSIDTANKAPFNRDLTTPRVASFNFVYTKPGDIEKIIRNLKPKSSAVYGNISKQLLKEIENAMKRPLIIIINQSHCTSIFPDKLKIGKVIPLYKKDDDRSIGNYRPISLLSSISKIFERVAFNQLYEYSTFNQRNRIGCASRLYPRPTFIDNLYERHAHSEWQPQFLFCTLMIRH